MPTAPTGPAVFAMAGASATSTVAEALRRFRAGEDVGPLPTPEPAPPARPPAATGKVRRAVFTRPNGEPYYAREVPDAAHDVDLIRRCRGTTVHDSVFVLAFGDPGTGKSSVFEVAFPDLVTVTCNRDTMMDDLLGTWVQMPDGTYEWVYGPFAVAAMEGRPVLLDEVAVVPGSVLTDLHEAMDGRGRLRVKANPRLPVIDIAPGFWVGAACNPDAPGADMSDAWLSRFGVHIEYTTDYDLAVEAGVPRKFVEVALNLRAKREERKVRYVHQMRELLQAKADAERFGLTLAVRNFVGKAPVEDRPLVADVASRKFGFAVEPLRTGPAVSG